MTLLQRIAREPNAIAGLLLAGYGLLVAFGVLEFTATQFGAVTAFGGALVVLIRWLVTPAAEVVAQQKPDEANPVAGPAAEVTTGAPVLVSAAPGSPPAGGMDAAWRGDRGAGEARLFVIIVAAVVVAVILVALIR